MREILLAVVVVGMLAGSSLGVINIKLTTDAHPAGVAAGTVVTVSIWGQGTAAGLSSLGGKVVATGPSMLVSNPGSFQWTPAFTSPAPFSSTYGSPAANGGWNGFGSQQTNYLAPDNTFAKADYVKVASYTVTIQPIGAFSTVNLAFVSGTYGGFRPVETNKSTTIGTITGTAIVPPEPATILLLALGSVLASRRRSR